MLELPCLPPLVGGFIMSPSTAMIAIIGMTQITEEILGGGDHGMGRVAGAADARRRAADERGGESSVLGLSVDVVA